MRDATRSKELLELNHIDMYNITESITLIDDLSLYRYGYLIHESSQVIDILEVFIIEAE